MSMELWCAEGVFLARVREDIVVLDVNADRYHCLLDAADWMVLGKSGSVTVPDEPAARELLSAGIAMGDCAKTPRRRPEAARRQFATAAAPSRWSLFRTGVAIASTTMAFRGLPLRQLIAGSAGSPGPVRPVDDRCLGETVAAFQGALPWVPFEGECLQRAFQLRRVLTGRGIHADWIFGVRTWPFAAHCWLQIGDLVIADTLERVDRYTPIMVA
ncbi:MAG: lasso peptide biosynthesis B2 protein [Brevundimonas sp.]